jgi:hypothetical protein
MKDIHSQKDTRTLRLITQRRGEHTNKKKSYNLSTSLLPDILS